MLADAVIITITDCKKGFLYEALDGESSYLTTFDTEFGRFRFTAMPFRNRVAGDVFQRSLTLSLAIYHKSHVLQMTE